MLIDNSAGHGLRVHDIIIHNHLYFMLPATAAPTTRFATTRLATTVIVTIPVDCVDFSEVELCTITKEEGNCDSEFGQAQCCMTCAVNESCRDLYDGCHKVRQYGLCGEPEYQTDCCASCVYKQP